MLAVGGFVAMLSDVPGKDANLIEVVRQTVARLGDGTEILGNFFVGPFFSWVLNLMEHEKRDETLPFGILRHIERNIDVYHAGEHPAHAVLLVPHQPPVFEHQAGRRFPWLGRSGSRAWLLLCRGAL